MRDSPEEVESALETSSIADSTSSGLLRMLCDNSATSSCIGIESILDIVIHSVKLVIRPQSSNMEHKWQVQPHVQLTLYFSAARLLSDHNLAALNYRVSTDLLTAQPIQGNSSACRKVSNLSKTSQRSHCEQAVSRLWHLDQTEKGSRLCT